MWNNSFLASSLGVHLSGPRGEGHKLCYRIEETASSGYSKNQDMDIFGGHLIIIIIIVAIDQFIPSLRFRRARFVNTDRTRFEELNVSFYTCLRFNSRARTV